MRRATSASAGGCHPQEYLGATTEVFPPYDTREEFIGARTYAGRTCKAYLARAGNARTQRCTYAPKGFSPYRGGFSWSRPAGLNLLIHIYAEGHEEPEDAMPYMTAQEVQEAIRVSRSIFLPHITGGFKIMDQGPR